MEESPFKSSLQTAPTALPLQIPQSLPVPFHHLSFFKLQTQSPESEMETMALCEGKNKENIPLFSSKQTHPVLGITPSSTKIVRRKFRTPLADITNLFNSSPQSASASHGGSQLPPSVAVCVCAPSSRKRKAGDTDSMQSTLFKALRRDFR